MKTIDRTIRKTSLAVMKVVSLALLGALWNSAAQAATLPTNGCTPAAMQSVINAASNGDTVKMTDVGGVTPCITTWSTGFISTSKGITLNGNGSTITRISGSSSPLFTITASSTMFRLTNFNFVQTAGTGGGADTTNNVLTITGTPSSAKFRIDHSTMTGSASPTIFMVIRAWGVLDNNTLSAPNNSEMIHIKGPPGSWTDSVVPGSQDAVYLETNVFTNNGTGNASSSAQLYDGARMVYRHNTMNNTQVDVHGTAGQTGGRWFEIYENDFINPPGPKASDKFADLRAGSGVVFNNRLIAGGEEIFFREEDGGTWPVAYQIGSGSNGGTDGHSTCAGARGTLANPSNTAPVYVWNNQMPTRIHSTSTSGTLVEGRDFIVSASQPSVLFQANASADTCSHSYSYAPLAYPHPLTTGSTLVPAAPEALSAL